MFYDIEEFKNDPQKCVDSFHENGFLIVENVIEPERCDYIKNRFVEYAESIGNNDLSEMPNAHENIPEVLDFMKDKNVALIVESILGKPSFGMNSVAVLKKAGTPSSRHAWNPHQDASYTNDVGYMCTDSVGGDIALDDHLPGSGCMYAYAGSNAEPVLPYAPNKTFNRLDDGSNPGNRVLEMDRIEKEYKKVDLYLKKGTFFVFHGNMIHGSNSNTSSNLWRPVLLMNYIKDGAADSIYKGKAQPRKPISLR